MTLGQYISSTDGYENICAYIWKEDFQTVDNESNPLLYNMGRYQGPISPLLMRTAKLDITTEITGPDAIIAALDAENMKNDTVQEINSLNKKMNLYFNTCFKRPDESAPWAKSTDDIKRRSLP